MLKTVGGFGSDIYIMIISLFLKYKSQNYQLLYLLKENAMKREWNRDCINDH